MRQKHAALLLLFLMVNHKPTSKKVHIATDTPTACQCVHAELVKSMKASLIGSLNQLYVRYWLIDNDTNFP